MRVYSEPTHISLPPVLVPGPRPPPPLTRITGTGPQWLPFLLPQPAAFVKCTNAGSHPSSAQGTRRDARFHQDKSHSLAITTDLQDLASGMALASSPATLLLVVPDWPSWPLTDPSPARKPRGLDIPFSCNALSPSCPVLSPLSGLELRLSFQRGYTYLNCNLGLSLLACQSSFTCSTFFVHSTYFF